MIESPDFRDPVHGIPVFSLYGDVRRPSEEMLDHFDVLLVDLQDLGCRIYTFITTLLYVLEAAAQHGKTVWVLDRPNPAGRPIEGLKLREGWESFVGAGPMPMRHGLTVGELGIWFVSHFHLAVDYRVIPMRGWNPESRPGFRLAGGRAQLGESQSERGQPVHGARLRRHGDARGHDAVRGPRHHAAAGVVRRAGPRSALAADHHESHHARVAARLSPAALLVRAHVPETRRQVVLGIPDPRRGRRLRARRVPAVAPGRRRVQMHPPAARRISAVARFSVRVRTGRGWPSISSMAASCCASGWKIRRRRRPISTSWRRATKRSGPSSAPTSCSIAEKCPARHGTGTHPGPAGRLRSAYLARFVGLRLVHRGQQRLVDLAHRIREHLLHALAVRLRTSIVRWPPALSSHTARAADCSFL